MENTPLMDDFHDGLSLIQLQIAFMAFAHSICLIQQIAVATSTHVAGTVFDAMESINNEILQ